MRNPSGRGPAAPDHPTSVAGGSLRASLVGPLLAAVLAASCADAQGEKATPKAVIREAPKTRGIRVEVATLAMSRPTLDLVLPGEVEGSKEAHLASALGGYVEKVLADVGDRVKEGQPIAQVDRARLDVLLEMASVQAAQAASDLELVDRAGKSLPKARKDASTFAKQAADANLKLAQLNADRATVRAPFSGVVAEVSVERGEVLPPGGAVATIVKLDPIEISLSVSDQDVMSLTEGVAVKAHAGAQVFDGRIARVSPTAHPDMRTFEVEVEIPNAGGGLRPGMIATVQIAVALGEEALTIPQYVLVTRLDGNGVFVDDAGVARWRPLALGSVVRGQVVVRSGLSAGERIVVTGHRELEDGDALIVGRAGKCCAGGQVAFEE